MQWQDASSADNPRPTGTRRNVRDSLSHYGECSSASCARVDGTRNCSTLPSHAVPGIGAQVTQLVDLGVDPVGPRTTIRFVRYQPSSWDYTIQNS
jgi:hypothetical protein